MVTCMLLARQQTNNLKPTPHRPRADFCSDGQKSVSSDFPEGPPSARHHTAYIMSLVNPRFEQKISRPRNVKQHAQDHMTHSSKPKFCPRPPVFRPHPHHQYREHCNACLCDQYERHNPGHKLNKDVYIEVTCNMTNILPWPSRQQA